MANEAVLVLKYEEPIDFIVADGTGITKGAILKLTDPRTASLSAGASDYVAGIAARDKVASDGRTRLATFRRGIFRIKLSGAVTAGQAVVTSGQENILIACPNDTDSSKTLGIALETNASGLNYKEVELNIGCNSEHT
jgi:hypothetical protein